MRSRVRTNGKTTGKKKAKKAKRTPKPKVERDPNAGKVYALPHELGQALAEVIGRLPVAQVHGLWGALQDLETVEVYLAKKEADAALTE